MNFIYQVPLVANYKDQIHTSSFHVLLFYVLDRCYVLLIDVHIVRTAKTLL